MYACMGDERGNWKVPAFNLPIPQIAGIGVFKVFQLRSHFVCNLKQKSCPQVALLFLLWWETARITELSVIL